MKRPNLYDRLKVLAVLTMIVDHVGYVFFPENLRLRLVGRVAFPIFLFLVGFNASYKRRRDLLLRAALVQIPIFVAAGYFHFGSAALNILFGIIIGRAVLQLATNGGIKTVNNKNLKMRFGLLVFAITIVLLLIHPWLKEIIDYGSFVILFPLMGFLFRKYFSSGDGLKASRIFNLLYSILIFVCLFVFTQMIFGFSLIQLCILGGFFILLLCIFFVLGQGNHFLPIGKKIDASVLFISKNALLIYVFHLLAMWIIKIFLMSDWLM